MVGRINRPDPFEAKAFVVSIRPLRPADHPPSSVGPSTVEVDPSLYLPPPEKVFDFPFKVRPEALPDLLSTAPVRLSDRNREDVADRAAIGRLEIDLFVQDAAEAASKTNDEPAATVKPEPVIAQPTLLGKLLARFIKQ